ncbi:MULTISPECIES: hypothetical protein [unclassified Sphingobium]|uniref:hypothetical protein n=1 Tax=unclassified Sphingobium TaxID=2611147 RepID=UPI000835717B|nr:MULTISPECIES: hypothetical protein [unclassified Sphingobium]NML87996.1 hypothetical protein [Sphingobium sp. TB-6]
MNGAKRSGLIVIGKDVVDRMLHLETGRTDEALNARFGISYNSWRKVIAGRPVRSSMAARLMQRVESIDPGAPDSFSA